ncbi:hypothetical protein ABT039_22495 [Streptomyces lasiicapitis]|uniref:hypothetical protein n=1 Tax=Streptomyces lasiicapitis TaxID=1923961 RepID=UPI0033325718
MPLNNLLTGLAATALQDSDIDPASIEVSVANGQASITFASTGDPAHDRDAAEQISGELCISLQTSELTMPIVVRPKEDEAALAAAADSLRHLATLLDRARTADDPAQPAQMGRATALRFAENVLSNVG